MSSIHIYHQGVTHIHSDRTVTLADKQGFHCDLCKEYHDELPLAMGPQAPAEFFQIPQDEVEERAALSPDLCVIDQKSFFICGNLEIPIINSEDVFSWDIWVSLAREDFAVVLDSWEDQDRQNLPPFGGVLANTLPGYPETQNLSVFVHTRPVGRKPLISMEPSDHVLSQEQQNGISLQQVQKIAQLVLHPEHSLEE